MQLGKAWCGGEQQHSGSPAMMPIAGRPSRRKDPDFGHAGDRGTSEGMAGSARSSFPEGRRVAPDRFGCLGAAMGWAEQSRGRAFHALYDRIYRDDILWEAWGTGASTWGSGGRSGSGAIAAVEPWARAVGRRA